jgi:hypothetical protein
MAFRFVLLIILCSFLVFAADDLGRSSIFDGSSDRSFFNEIVQEDVTDDRIGLTDEFLNDDATIDDDVLTTEIDESLTQDTFQDEEFAFETGDDFLDVDDTTAVRDVLIDDITSDNPALDNTALTDPDTVDDFSDEEFVLDDAGIVVESSSATEIEVSEEVLTRDARVDEEASIQDVIKEEEFSFSTDANATDKDLTARIFLTEEKDDVESTEKSSEDSLRDFVVQEEKKPSLLKESLKTEAQQVEAQIVEPTLKRLEFLELRGSSLVSDDIRASFASASEAVIVQKSLVPVKKSRTVEHTKVSIVIRPTKLIYDFVLYEDIPKSVAEHVSELEFSNPNYVVLEDDPLIAWQFAVLDAPVELSYTVKKKIELLPVSVAAAGLVTREEAQYRSPVTSLRPFLLILFGIIVVALIGLWFSRQHRSVQRMYDSL